MGQPDFHIKLGDNSSNLFVTLEDENGDATSIENAQLRFKLGPIAGGTLVIDEPATNAQNGDGTDGTTGNAFYSWTTLPTDAGFYQAEFEVTYLSGDVQTFPNSGYISVYVLEDL